MTGVQTCALPICIIIICDSAIVLANFSMLSSTSVGVKFLITTISVSAPAFSNALAVSNSQFVPGNTGITTFGLATLIAGAKAECSE